MYIILGSMFYRDSRQYQCSTLACLHSPKWSKGNTPFSGGFGATERG